MADEKETMTVEKAVETLNEVANAKRDKTTKPDAELAKEAAAAAEVVQKAAAAKKGEEADKEAAVELQKKVDDAEKIAKDEKQKSIALETQIADLKKQVPGFTPRGGYGGDGGSDTAAFVALQKRGKSAYKTLITKRAREGDVVLKAFHQWNDDVLLAARILRKDVGVILKDIPELREFYEDELSRTGTDLAKAMAAATATAGAEWIPEIWSPDLVDLIRTERVLTAMFRRFPMNAPTMHISTLVTEFKAFTVAESTANTPYTVPAIVSDAGTGTVQLDAIEMAVASIFSKTFEEDSIIPALPEIRRRIIEGMSKGIEDAIVNGATGVHPDADVVAGDASTAWFGLRFVPAPLVPPTLALDGVNMSADNLLRMKLLQGRFGSRDSESIFVTSPQGFVKLLGVRGNSGDQLVLRADTFGPRAVLNSGALASIFGTDIIVSDLVKVTEDVSGVVPAMPGDRTELIRANKNAFWIGDRRILTVESDTAPLTRQRILVATERLIFKEVKPRQSATDFPVVRGLNIETT